MFVGERDALSVLTLGSTRLVLGRESFIPLRLSSHVTLWFFHLILRSAAVNLLCQMAGRLGSSLHLFLSRIHRHM